jgi:hypothetical protein
MKIEIRYHPPQFSKKAVAEYLGVNTLPKWVKSKPDWSDIKKLRESNNNYRCGITNWQQLLNILAPSFKSTKYGVYFSRYYNHKQMKQDFTKFGKFQSEGGHHIHLRGIVQNPVYQYELGVRAIASWVDKLEKLKDIGKIVIYLNDDSRGSKNFTLCMYSNPSAKEIDALESGWPPISKMTIKNFLKWAN